MKYMHIGTLILPDIHWIYWEDKKLRIKWYYIKNILGNLINFKIDIKLQEIANIKMKYKIWLIKCFIEKYI